MLKKERKINSRKYIWDIIIKKTFDRFDDIKN